MARTEVAVVCDLKEEGWPSMDLVADRLIEHLPAASNQLVSPTRIQPPLRRRFSNPAASTGASGTDAGRRFNLDRGLNRFWDYPRLLRGIRDRFDLFHVVDQTYSQLVHALPADRTVVTCHDLHIFASLFHEDRGKRSRAYRAMSRNILRGLGKARRIVVDTAAVGDAVVAAGIATRERIRVAHLGVDASFTDRADPAADTAAAALLGNDGAVLDLLHVGGTFARKRVDLAFRIFAEVKKVRPEARLIRVGGAPTAELAELARNLGVERAIVSLPFISTEVLAAVYRRAALTIMPSEEEGFGFPVLESMRCGTPVVASNLPVLREVGGDAAEYRDISDIPAWSAAVAELLEERDRDSAGWDDRRRKGLRHAAKFTWPEYAKAMTNVYTELQ